VDTLLRRRIQLLAGCRLLAVVEVACSLLLAGGMASGIGTAALVWPGLVIFGTGTTVAILTLVWCQVVTLRISTGEDIG